MYRAGVMGAPLSEMGDFPSDPGGSVRGGSRRGSSSRGGSLWNAHDALESMEEVGGSFGKQHGSYKALSSLLESNKMGGGGGAAAAGWGTHRGGGNMTGAVAGSAPVRSHMMGGGGMARSFSGSGALNIKSHRVNTGGGVSRGGELVRSPSSLSSSLVGSLSRIVTVHPPDNDVENYHVMSAGRKQRGERDYTHVITRHDVM